jgi:dihydroorotate dehydrogenase (fumarate)
MTITHFYVDLLPPCNIACPAGENIQRWLGLAEAASANLGIEWRKRQSEVFERGNAMDLTTYYMGLPLKNPLVSSASPLNGELDNIRRLEDAGAAAIVLPSIFEEQIEAEMHEALTAVRRERSPEARSNFHQAEKSGPRQSLDFIRRAADAVDIPIIGSLNGTTDEGWISYAKLIKEAGAAALELNIYLIPTDLSLTGRDVEQHYLAILRQVHDAIDIPIAIKLGPYFSSLGHLAMEFTAAGAAALVLFNRFYQPDIDLVKLRLLNDLQLSRASEINLPLLWIAVLSGQIEASLAASTGVEDSDQVVKYLLAGADVVMTTSALLRNGPQYVDTLLTGLKSWLSARNIESVREVRGLLSQKNFRNPDSFGRVSYMKILQGYQIQEPARSEVK